MASTYTTSGIELIASGEQSGTWGDTTNDNWEIVDLQLNSRLSKTLSTAGSSGSPNALTITDGDKTSEGMYASVVFVDGGDLGANAYVRLEPNDVKRQIWVRNSLSASRSIFLFQGTYNASNDIELLNGYDYLVSFDGAGAGAVVTQVNNSFPATTFGLTEDELTQLQNIDSTTVSTAQWGYLGAMNQGVTTTSNVTFGTITGTGDMAIDTDTLFVDVSADSVGIGTATPAAPFHVKAPGTTGDDIAYFDDTGSGSTGRLTIQTTGGTGSDALRLAGVNRTYLALGSSSTSHLSVNLVSGYVGIGTASPGELLEVAGSDAAIKVSGTANNAFLKFETGTANYNAILFGDTVDADTGGIYYFHNSNYMTFRTNGNVERVRISSSGNVGIGTPSPQAALDVEGGIRASGSSAGVQMESRDGTGTVFQWYNPTGDELRLYGTSDLLVVTTGGNVGIGTTSPSAEFEVDGEAVFLAAANGSDSGTLDENTQLRGHITPLSGNVTMPTATAGCHGVLITYGTARTVTRGSGLTMYVNGTNSASATITARGVCGFVFETATVCHLKGDVS